MIRINKPMTAKMRSPAYIKQQDEKSNSINRTTLISTGAPMMSPASSLKNANLTRGFGSSDHTNNTRGRRKLDSYLFRSEKGSN